MRKDNEDILFNRIIIAFPSLIVLVLGGLFATLCFTAWPALTKFGFSFVTRSIWDPVFEKFGVLPFIYGTLLTSFIALLVAVPIGLGAAIYLAEYAPWQVRKAMSLFIDLLAAIPSVIYGLWGIFVLAPVLRDFVEPALARSLGFLPFFQGPIYGVGFLTAGLILAVMVVPFIVSVSREVILAVPKVYKEAAYAVGATRWEAVTWIILSYGKAGIVGGIVLALGRAIGETMAVTMVIGNNPKITASLFSPGYTLASVIANEFSEATTDMYTSALIGIGLVLLCVSIGVNVLARFLIWSVSTATSDALPMTAVKPH